VKIEVEKSAIRVDILLPQVPQERTPAGTGLAKDDNMYCAAGIAQANMPPRHLTILDTKPEIKIPRFLPCSAFPPSKPVPECYNKFFDEVDHHGFSLQGAATKSVTTGR
jgi:hypothetical protein